MTELDSLPPELESLVDHERAELDPVSEEDRAAILEATLRAIDVPRSPSAPRRSWLRLATVGVVGASLGFGAGVFVGRAQAPRSHERAPGSIELVDAAAAAISTVAALTPEQLPVAQVEGSAPLAHVAPARPALRDAAAPSASRVSQERALLDRCVNALARGNDEAAREALSQHERQFATGTFREEREMLWIKLLVQQGNGDEARARASRFERAFPGSVFLPTVRDLAEK